MTLFVKSDLHRVCSDMGNSPYITLHPPFHSLSTEYDPQLRFAEHEKTSQNSRISRSSTTPSPKLHALSERRGKDVYYLTRPLFGRLSPAYRDEAMHRPTKLR